MILYFYRCLFTEAVSSFTTPHWPKVFLTVLHKTAEFKISHHSIFSRQNASDWCLSVNLMGTHRLLAITPGFIFHVSQIIFLPDSSNWVCPTDTEN